jgi:hypothetical protein
MIERSNKDENKSGKLEGTNTAGQALYFKSNQLKFKTKEKCLAPDGMEDIAEPSLDHYKKTRLSSNPIFWLKGKQTPF